jgi:hypothetical protein
VCKSTIVLYLNAIKRTYNQGANTSNHPNENLSFSSRVPPYMRQYLFISMLYFLLDRNLNLHYVNLE